MSSLAHIPATSTRALRRGLVECSSHCTHLWPPRSVVRGEEMQEKKEYEQADGIKSRNLITRQDREIRISKNQEKCRAGERENTGCWNQTTYIAYVVSGLDKTTILACVLSRCEIFIDFFFHPLSSLIIIKKHLFHQLPYYPTLPKPRYLIFIYL